MNRFLTAPLLLCLFLSLTACGGKPQDGAKPPEDIFTQDTAAAPEVPPSADMDVSEAALSTEDEARRTAFAQVLRTAHDQQILPDGTALDGNSIEGIEGNLFSLHDVDGDGRQELILLWQNAIMAGQMEIVYGFDETSGELREKLREFPGIIFYAGGTAEAPWSHNQGWANQFWPYTLYRWQAETDTYENVGSVDAWDSALVSQGFPRDVDGDGDGMVYFLLTDNWNFTAHRDPDSGEEYWYYEEPPVDGTEYLAWRDGVVGDAQPLELSFVPLTAENIARVLEVPYEPLVTTLTPNALG